MKTQARYMYRFLVYAITFIFFLTGLFSCQKKASIATYQLTQAHKLLYTHPEQAYLLLDSIEYPENLNAQQNARWCMMMGQIADTLHTDLPYSHQLERAAHYYQHKGSANEQARILLYLGRAYVEDGNYEDAMHTYLKAQDIALKIKDFNLAGYINSYMGDMYEFKAMYPKAKDKYLQAADFFKFAKNQRSQAFALRDAGRQAAFSDSLNIGLHYMQEAEKLIRPIGNLSDIGSIINGIGNIFQMKGEYAKDKNCFKQTIKENYPYCLPDFLALSHIYIQENQLDSARLCLQAAEQLNNNTKLTNLNEDIPIGMLQARALIEEKKHNYKQALTYLKEYIELSDSIMFLRSQNEVITAEKKYNQSKLSAENKRLKLIKHRYFTGGILLLLFASLMTIIYQLRLNKKNKKINHQELELQNKNAKLNMLAKDLALNKAELQNLSLKIAEQQRLNIDNVLLETQYVEKQQETKNLNLQIQQQRLQLFQEANITKRLYRLSEKIVAGKQKPLLGNKDWAAIETLIRSIYPPIYEFLQNNNLTDKEQQCAYLSVFGFDTNREAVLLGVQVDSVNKYRSRVRQKLQLTGQKINIHDFLHSLLD